MAWTYDAASFGDPSAGAYPGSTVGDRNLIRFLTQDNQPSRPLMQDEELEWLDASYGNVYLAAAAACDILVARAGPIGTRKVGDLSITYDPKFYMALAAELRAKGLVYQAPSAGGLSIAEKIAQASDSDAVRPAFYRGLDDNPGAPQPGATSPTALTRGV